MAHVYDIRSRNYINQMPSQSVRVKGAQDNGESRNPVNRGSEGVTTRVPLKIMNASYMYIVRWGSRIDQCIDERYPTNLVGVLKPVQVCVNGELAQ